LLRHVDAGRPLLGICLGMQLLFEYSEENPGVKGLGLLEGIVVRFPGYVKVPHIGWNDVRPTKDSTLFGKTGVSSGCFYFVHSFCITGSPLEIATTDYGVTFTSAVEKDNVMAVQFHPEKSQSNGLALLKNFVGG
jgi:glutamine amidotransferase